MKRRLMELTKMKRAYCIPILVMLFFSNSYAAVLLDRVVAVVNKEVITWGELYKAMELDASSEMKSLSDEAKKKILKENEAIFLESMIDMKLQLQAAKSLDIDASGEEIAEAIEGIKKKHALGDKEFIESLKKEGFNPEEYRKRLAEQIILSKIVGQQVRNKIVITDEEIRDYMSKNKDAGYRIRQIFFRKPEKDSDRKALEDKANGVFQKLKSGEDFILLARQYSDDATGRAGGDLGFIKKEHLGKEFIEVISQMNAGDISQPFRTERGLHIIRLEEKSDATNADAFRETARSKIFDKRFKEEYRNWTRGLRERAYIEVRL